MEVKKIVNGGRKKNWVKENELNKNNKKKHVRSDLRSEKTRSALAAAECKAVLALDTNELLLGDSIS